MSVRDGYADAYHARTEIERALEWLRDKDGWTRAELEDLADQSVERIYEDD